MESNGTQNPGVEENGLHEQSCALPDLSFSFSDMTDLAYPSAEEANGNVNGTADMEGSTGDDEDQRPETTPGPEVNGVQKTSVNGEGDNGTNRWTEMVAELGEPLEIMEEMSAILNTGLKQESLYSAFKLLQSGADHRVLAQVVKQWRDQKREKPQKKLGHYFDTTDVDEDKQKKPEWLW